MATKTPRQEKFNVRKNLTTKSVRLRSTEGDQVRQFAIDSNRSLNASIIYILTEFMDFSDQHGMPTLIKEDPNEGSEHIYMNAPMQIRYTEEEGERITKYFELSGLPSFNLFVIAVVYWFFQNAGK